MNNVRLFQHVLIAASLLVAAGSSSAADVGVSISIGQPGFYGRIDIGDYPYPLPRVIYRQPVIVHRHVEFYEPIYLRVPPGHYKRWSRYCDRYDACDRPVYFVQERWYSNEFVPVYRERHGWEGHDRYDDHRHQQRGDRHGRGGHGRD